MLMTAVILGVLGCLVLGGLHWWLTRRSSPWPGAIVPAIAVAGLVFVFVRGHIDTPLEYVGSAMVLVTLLRMWDEGRRVRAAQVGAP